MNLKKILKNNLVFSLVVTLIVILTDSLYHYLTGLFIHRYYTTVKLVIVFLTVYFIAIFWKKGLKQGFITAIIASLSFFLYYRIYFWYFTGNFFFFVPILGDSPLTSVVHFFIIFIVYYFIYRF